MLRRVQIKGIIYTFLIKSFHTSKSNNTKRLSKKERDNFTLKQLPLVRDLIQEYIHPTMLYKLNIDPK